MHRRRLRVLFLVMVAMALVIQGRLVVLQLVRGEHYRDYADRQSVALSPIDVARGRILTGDGVVLAEDRLRYDVAVIIGRLDPSDERAIRRPLRRLFWVSHRQKLVRIAHTEWRLRTENGPDGEARVVVEAESELEVEVLDRSQQPLLKVVHRKNEFPLPDHLIRSVIQIDRLTRPTREELAGAAGELLDAARATAGQAPPDLVRTAVDKVGSALDSADGDLRRALRAAAAELTARIEEHEGDDLPAGFIAAADRLHRKTRDRRQEILADVLDTAVDVARLRTPVFAPVPIIEDVCYDRSVVPIETQPDQFRGFVIQPRRRRDAEAVLAPHLIGYVSGFNEADVERKLRQYPGWPGRSYFLQQRAGRDGIEHHFDDLLRGRFGVECIERDHLNRPQRELARAPATPARDVVLTIDSRLQAIVEDALANAAYRGGRPAVGAAVVADVHTGHILAIASSPTYDPAAFNSARAYQRLVDDPDHPLFNRAMRARLPLGSVFKLVTALAGLENGAGPARIHCSGGVQYGRRYFRCHSPHGTLDLEQAIQRSCNSYFFVVGRQIGDTALIDMARRFGFGRRTGVEFPSERPGNVPARAAGGELLNMTIGQGQLAVTPVQTVQMIAALANGGTLVPVTLVRELRTFQADDGGQPLHDSRRPEQLGISRSSLDTVRAGMYRSVNEQGGTGRVAFTGFNRPFKVCGKTSTAQRTVRRNGEVVVDNVGWFAGFAPHDRPQIAFAVAVERLSRGDSGSRTAGPIARDILDRIPLDLLGIEGEGRGR